MWKQITPNDATTKQTHGGNAIAVATNDTTTKADAAEANAHSSSSS
jgi:hypothetical protein